MSLKKSIYILKIIIITNDNDFVNVQRQWLLSFKSKSNLYRLHLAIK